MRERTNPLRLELRHRLRRLCVGILRRAGVEEGQYTVQDTGDGYLFFIEPQAQKSRLLDALVAHLDRGLESGNRGRPPSERLRVRVAFHAGDVLSDPEHMHGGATIFTCRLLDSAPLRACLGAARSAVALIVSEAIYEDIVKHGYGQIDPAAFHQVAISEKEARAHAWIHVPGDHDAPRRAGVAGRAQAAPAAEAPRELPPAVSPFTGRRKELAWIRGRLRRRRAGTVAVVVVHGPGGVGKSALAVRAAQQVAHLFPDGQLYANLLGAEREQPPLDPRTALDQFLHSLGAPPAGSGAKPREGAATLHESAARYRSALAGRKVLVLLDNASRSTQVAPLLPGSGSCAVLVTSRSALDELDGAERLALDVLDPAHAAELLRRCLGAERAAREPEAVAEVARYCGYLPLALRIVAARLAVRPAWTIGSMAQRLADGNRRLDELQRGDLAVRASLEVSYQTLRAGPSAAAVEAARAFRLLGLLEGDDFGLPAASALLDRPVEAAEAALEQLVDEHLLESRRHGRYGFHDLLRLLARECVEAEEPAAERVAAISRLAGFYLPVAEAANGVLRPRRPEPSPGGGGEPGAPAFANRGEALAWLELEYTGLVDAIHQAARTAGVPAAAAGRLAHALFTFFMLRNNLADWQRVSESVLGAARRDGDARTEGQAHNALGCVAHHRHQHDDAVRHYERSLELRRLAGDRDGEAGTLCNLGISRREQARHDEAIACYRQSLAIYRELDDRLAEGQTVNNLGHVYQALGRHELALDHHLQALAICQAIDDGPGEINALYSLGQVCHKLGRLEDAVGYYLRDLDLSREFGDVHGRAVTLNALGVTLHALGQQAEAEACLREALATFERLQAPEASAVRALLYGKPPG